MSIPTIRLAVAFCSLGAALPATAADVRAQLSPDLISKHCQVAGVGSETEGTFMLPDGRVTGTVHCTDTDLVAPKVAASSRHRDDDDDHGRRHEEDDDDDDRNEDDD